MGGEWAKNEACVIDARRSTGPAAPGNGVVAALGECGQRA